MRLKVVVSIIAVLAVVIVAIFAGLSRQSRWPRCNVLLITLDTTRADRLGCYGYAAARTPVLDQLAREGALFENAYCTVPLTLPSHASIMTGLYPPELGVRLNALKILPDDVPTLAQVLGSNGYATAAFIASPILGSKFGIGRGFQEYNEDFSSENMSGPGDFAYRPGDKVADSSIEWLKANAGHPFFCWVHFYDPHYPYETHEDVFGNTYSNRPYDAEIAFVDRQIGRIRAELKRNGSLDRTLIIVSGDHGESTPEDHFEPKPHHGFLVYNGTMRVPLMFSMPSTIRGGQRIDTAVSLVDVFSTILSLTHIPSATPPKNMGLSSLLGVGPRSSLSPCYGESDLSTSYGWAPLKSIKSGSRKYIRTTIPELYDLASDPGEATNLASRLPQEVRQMEAELNAFETSLTHRTAKAARISSQDQRRIESLGYVAGGVPGSTNLPQGSLRDIKEMLPLEFKVQEALNLVTAGRPGEALETLRMICQGSPETVRFRNAYASALTEAGRISDAVDEFQKLIMECDEDDKKKGPSSSTDSWRKNAIYPIIINNLAYALSSQGNFKEALPLATEAVREDRDNPVYAHTLATVYKGLGQLDSAREYARRALSLDPQNPDHLILVAELAREENQIEAASLARQALQSSSTTKSRAKALNLLKALSKTYQ